MRHLRHLLVAALTALPAAGALAQVTSTPAPPAIPSPAPVAALDRLVGVAVGADLDGVAAGVGATVAESFGDGLSPLGLGGPGWVARLSWPDAAAAARGAQALERRADVTFVELDRVGSPHETGSCGPAAPVSVQQCTAAFFDGTPTLPEYVRQPALPAIDLGGLGPSVPGAATVVAVIDTGVDPTHPALSGRLAGPGYDFVANRPGGFEVANGADDDLDGLVDEGHGHGTHVAGTITLIDPDAYVLPYRVLDDEGNGFAFKVALAIRAAEEEGAQFINLSLGLAQESAAVRTAIDSLDEEEIIVLTSAGNSGLPWVGHPARTACVVTVAAVDVRGVLPTFASHGDTVDLVAPGVDVYGPMPGGAWARWSGSSMAVAVATGAASRLHSWRMIHEPEEVIEALGDGASSVDGFNPHAAGLLGEGIVQVGAASRELE